MLSNALLEDPRGKLEEGGERFSSPLWWEPNDRADKPCRPVDAERQHGNGQPGSPCPSGQVHSHCLRPGSSFSSCSSFITITNKWIYLTFFLYLRLGWWFLLFSLPHLLWLHGSKERWPCRSFQFSGQSSLKEDNWAHVAPSKWWLTLSWGWVYVCLCVCVLGGGTALHLFCGEKLPGQACFLQSLCLLLFTCCRCKICFILSFLLKGLNRIRSFTPISPHLSGQKVILHSHNEIKKKKKAYHPLGHLLEDDIL